MKLAAACINTILDRRLFRHSGMWSIHSFDCEMQLPHTDAPERNTNSSTLWFGNWNPWCSRSRSDKRTPAANFICATPKQNREQERLLLMLIVPVSNYCVARELVFGVGACIISCWRIDWSLAKSQFYEVSQSTSTFGRVEHQTSMLCCQ